MTMLEPTRTMVQHPTVELDPDGELLVGVTSSDPSCWRSTWCEVPTPLGPVPVRAYHPHQLTPERVQRAVTAACCAPRCTR